MLLDIITAKKAEHVVYGEHPIRVFTQPTVNITKRDIAPLIKTHPDMIINSFTLPILGIHSKPQTLQELCSTAYSSRIISYAQEMEEDTAIFADEFLKEKVMKKSARELTLQLNRELYPALFKQLLSQISHHHFRYSVPSFMKLTPAHLLVCDMFIVQKDTPFTLDIYALDEKERRNDIYPVRTVDLTLISSVEEEGQKKFEKLLNSY